MGIVAMSLGWLRPPGETIEYVSAMVSNNSLRDEENPRPYGSLGGGGCTGVTFFLLAMGGRL
jgi:hypothetical protein